MPGSTGQMELWRRVALVMAILIGTFMVFSCQTGCWKKYIF